MSYLPESQALSWRGASIVNLCRGTKLAPSPISISYLLISQSSLPHAQPGMEFPLETRQGLQIVSGKTAGLVKEAGCDLIKNKGGNHEQTISAAAAVADEPNRHP